jgi:acyl-coenzyme A synthetase/AMP-(fatty) acid ligase/3-hydroxymyristoyl/3-hydroxydecanoyl-(acyl carrier protein) dehydratase
MVKVRELARLLPLPANDQIIAKHRGFNISTRQFQQAVGYWRDQLAAESKTAVALYCHDAYPFAVLLFAAWHAGKKVWLPANNTAGTAAQLTQNQCRLLGDWQTHSDNVLTKYAPTASAFSPLHQQQTELVIFTSGSTGEAKAIPKTLWQLQTEINTLEQCWGRQLGDSTILGTVSQQHIYGLLFRVLWPLAAGRCFHSEAALSPEVLVKQASPACWVASPAHLKRLDEDSPWDELANLSLIFSSGGVLPADSATQIAEQGRKAVIEIYGSSETGGIGWRQYPAQNWTLFPGMQLSKRGDSWYLNSPYLPDQPDFELDDCLSLQANGQFLLLGRRDRTVKIEEKRLSLCELERRLTDTAWLYEAAALVINHHRDTVAISAVLSEEGKHCLHSEGRSGIIKLLRAELAHWFEAVLLPRKWLFLSQLPLTPQGKLDNVLLRQLLAPAGDKLPQLQSVDLLDNRAELQLKVPASLVYFPVHFPQYPILPGVVQIGWAEHFAKILFPIDQPFCRMEVIKFIKPILPDCELTLQLNWKADSGKLHFQFNAHGDSYSSGRLVYGVVI